MLTKIFFHFGPRYVVLGVKNTYLYVLLAALRNYGFLSKPQNIYLNQSMLDGIK